MRVATGYQDGYHAGYHLWLSRKLLTPLGFLKLGGYWLPRVVITFELGYLPSVIT